MSNKILAKLDEFICPYCKEIMIHLEEWDSLLGLANWHKFGCEWCGGIFEVKIGKEIEAKEAAEKEERS